MVDTSDSSVISQISRYEHSSSRKQSNYRRPEEVVEYRLPALDCHDLDNSDVKEEDHLEFDGFAAPKVDT
jgi:hypothetical protein